MVSQWDEDRYVWDLEQGADEFIMKASGSAYRRYIEINGDMKVIGKPSFWVYWPRSQIRPSNMMVHNSNRAVPQNSMDRSLFRRHDLPGQLSLSPTSSKPDWAATVVMILIPKIL